ncbi:MAG: superoxide dismutase family protein [Burkholderiales bacterium]|nr:superoxide dismutase family protein [Burkholderiales bacterium]
MKTAIILVAVTVVLAACQSMSPEPLRATAQLQPTTGSKTIGEATFEQVGNKVHVVVFVQGLKPDQEHGMHIHEGGDCGADGMNAKGHFNPYAKPHAAYTSAERHAGDLPSLKANKKGRAKVDVELDLISVAHGPGSIVGRSLIVHAGPDDHTTQPTGNSGGRIACGVIKAD